MLPAKGGNDSRLRLPRSFGALVVPALLGTETGSQQDSQSISSGSRTSQVLIQTEDHASTVKEKSMSKFKIEKGVSRVARVKVQALIEKSIAADLLLMSEWSNNDKNYLVNQLLRFVLSRDGEFQAYKESKSQSRPEPPTKSESTMGKSETNALKEDASVHVQRTSNV
jgi:hypothetical protein